MEKDVVYIDRQGPIGVIVLNQPKKKNAISAVMMDKLADALNELEEDEGVRVIALTGEGENFCAGGDLDQPGPKPMTAEFSRKSLRRYIRAVNAIRSVGKPVIAMVRGYAVGGAVSLMLASDLVCLSEDAKIIPNFCKIGLIPELGLMSTLPAVVGPQKAKEILFFGERLSAADCLSLGIANRVFPEERFREDSMAFALKAAELPALSIQITKGIMNSATNAELAAVMEAESIGSPFCAGSEEFKSMSAKFQNK
ncbi:MAG TPA: enoyl-CoA hydratase [Clostridiales bacterium]|nr:enoyl-CoA hydratase [Clostridiales bacterium]